MTAVVHVMTNINSYIFKLHRMHEKQTIITDDCSVCP